MINIRSIPDNIDKDYINKNRLDLPLKSTSGQKFDDLVNQLATLKEAIAVSDMFHSNMSADEQKSFLDRRKALLDKGLTPDWYKGLAAAKVKALIDNYSAWNDLYYNNQVPCATPGCPNFVSNTGSKYCPGCNKRNKQNELNHSMSNIASILSSLRV